MVSTEPGVRKLLGSLGKALAVFLLGHSALAQSGASSIEPAALPAGIVGDWIVSRVLVDQQTERRTMYVPDDPRLLGRELSVSREEIRSELPEDTTCRQPKVLLKSTTLPDLLESTLPRRGGGAGLVRPEDYQLPARAGRVSVAWLACASSSFGPKLPKSLIGRVGVPDAHAWLVEDAPTGSLWMRWYDNTVLVLRRLSEQTRPRPSFACSGARPGAETAICKSVSLSAFDLSVARAYKLALAQCSGDAGCTNQLRRKQSEWLRLRNACGEREGCLRDAMRTRTDELMAEPSGR